MTVAEYLAKNEIEWDGAKWTAIALVMSSADMATQLHRSLIRFDSETAREMSTGGTFDVLVTPVQGKTERRRYTVVYDRETDAARLYRKN